MTQKGLCNIYSKEVSFEQHQHQQTHRLEQHTKYKVLNFKLELCKWFH